MPPHYSDALPWADALRRVIANQGCAGVDGESCAAWKRNGAAWLPRLRRQYAAGGYEPLPLRLALIRKPQPHGPAKQRPLLIAAVRDRIVQTAWSLRLAPAWDAQASPASFAYRPGLGTPDACRAVAAALRDGFHWVLDADISRFFDSIPHSLLQAAFAAWVPPSDYAAARFLAQWLTAATVWDGQTVRPLVRGIPQGSPLSPPISNRFLRPLDQALHRPPCRLVRYADDFLVLARSEKDVRAAQCATVAALARLGLELHPAKTTLRPPGSRFLFLGAQIDSRPGHESAVPVTPSPRQDELSFLAPSWAPRQSPPPRGEPFDPTAPFGTAPPQSTPDSLSWAAVWKWLVS